MTDKIRNELLLMKDTKYKEFHEGLLPNDFNAIGVRIPVLREISKRMAKKLSSFDEIKEFVYSESIFYEEKMIKGLVIGYLNIEKEYILELLDEYVLKIDNWGICDCVSTTLKIFEKNKDYFYKFIEECLESDKEFVVRFGIVNLLMHYINDAYIDRIIEKIKKVYPEYYYIDMAVAWLICECFIKYKDKTKLVFDYKLKRSINNKAISKICDSFRVAKEEKDKMKLYRVK